MTAHPYTEGGFETIGVNLSVVQCMQESLADDLIAVMEHYKLPPGRFKFEITETVAAASMSTLRSTMERLIDYALRLCPGRFRHRLLWRHQYAQPAL